jgi:hypothetical protein
MEVWVQQFGAHVAELDRGIASAEACVCPKAFLQRAAPANTTDCEACGKDALKTVQSLLKTMYTKFKDDIVNAKKVEDRSKKFFSRAKTETNATIAQAFDASRAASHEHYRSMLKTAHAGMDRLKAALDLVGDKLAGKPLDVSELKQLKASMPNAPMSLLADAVEHAEQLKASSAPMSFLADLRQYCRVTLASLKAPVTVDGIRQRAEGSAAFKKKVESMEPALCQDDKTAAACGAYVQDLLFCFEFADELPKLKNVEGAEAESAKCKKIDQHMPGAALLQADPAPEDQLAHEMTHDLEMNFNKIAPFGKEDTAKELQDHAAKTQDTLVDAVENAEVAEIKRAVFRALTRLRAATIKEFDTIARLETQAIDAYNDAHHYRAENPLSHLHEDEAPVETDKLKSFHF